MGMFDWPGVFAQEKPEDPNTIKNPEMSGMAGAMFGPVLKQISPHLEAMKVEFKRLADDLATLKRNTDLSETRLEVYHCDGTERDYVVVMQDAVSIYVDNYAGTADVVVAVQGVNYPVNAGGTQAYCLYRVKQFTTNGACTVVVSNRRLE